MPNRVSIMALSTPTCPQTYQALPGRVIEKVSEYLTSMESVFFEIERYLNKFMNINDQKS